MKMHLMFLEPEILSPIFLLINLIGSIVIGLVVRSWPLSIIWTCVYLTFVFLINRRLAAGRYYLPTKNLHGQTVVVTGAATGVGRVCALQFSKLGARVIIGVRGQERAERVAKELSEESNGGTVVGHDLDLASLANVKLFAEKIGRVDILVNNAGTLHQSFLLTVDGIESIFATNHIGHFYLTQLLLPLLTNGRVVNVSSAAHHLSKPSDVDYSFSKLKENFDGMRAYSFSKLAQIYHASELTRRYGIKAYSLNPGFINTPIQAGHKLLHRLFIQNLTIISKTVEQGAMTSLYCALSDDAKPGHFHSNCQVRRSSQLSLDTRRADECWNESEKLIKEKMNVKISKKNL